MKIKDLADVGTIINISQLSAECGYSRSFLGVKVKRYRKYIDNGFVSKLEGMGELTKFQEIKITNKLKEIFSKLNLDKL